MIRKRSSDEDIPRVLRVIEAHISSSKDVPSACRAAGVSDATYYNWRKNFGGKAKSQLSEMMSGRN